MTNPRRLLALVLAILRHPMRSAIGPIDRGGAQISLGHAAAAGNPTQGTYRGFKSFSHNGLLAPPTPPLDLLPEAQAPPEVANAI